MDIAGMIPVAQEILRMHPVAFCQKEAGLIKFSLSFSLPNNLSKEKKILLLQSFITTLYSPYDAYHIFLALLQIN